MGIEVQRDDEGVADGFDFVVVLRDFVVQIDLMLEGVQVNIAAVERIVRGHIVGELHDLKVDAFGLQRFLRGLPEVLVDAADHAELDGGGTGFGLGGRAGGQRQG